MIQNELFELGLSDGEQKIYLALLQMGPSAAIPIAKKTGINRTTVYFLVKELTKKGLATSVERDGKTFFAVESPAKIIELIENQENSIKVQLASLERRKERINQILPELIGLTALSPRPRVRFFEGKEGVISAFEDTLNQPSGSEILMYSTTQGFYSQVPGYLDSYLKKRIKKDIHVRLILPDDPTSLEYVAKDREQLRRSRIIPASRFPFTNEIDIYQNKVAIVSLEQEWLAVIIESESIAKMQRSIFELAWEGALKYQRAN